MAAPQRKPPAPIDLVVLTRARLQEVVDEAVRRGRITRSDATDLVSELVARGRSGADGVLSGPLEMARRVAGSQPAITGYDELTAAQIPTASRASTGAAAQGARLRARNANRKTVLAAIEKPPGLADPRSVDPRPPPRTRARPRARSSSCTVDASPSAATASRGSTATSSSCAARCPATASARVVTKRKRAYAEARTVEVLEPSPDRDRAASPTIPGAPWQVLPYERQLEVKHEQVDDALRRIGQLDGFELEPIVPAVEQWRYRNKLEYSFGTGAGRRARLRLPRARARGSEIVADRRLPAGLRARQRRAPRAVLAWCARAGPRRLRPPRRRRACCATSSCARAGAPASCRCGSSPRRASSTPTRFAEARRRATALLLDAHRGRRRDDRRAARPSSSPAPSAIARGARRPALRDLARGVLPDEHRDGRAALRRRRASTPALQGWERVYDLFCGIGTIGLTLAAARRRGLGPRDRRGGGRRRDRQRARATRSTTRASSPATCASRCASSSSSAGRARRRRRRPAARGPVAEGRAPDHRGRARSGSSTSRATRRRSRRTPRSSSRRATRCAACGRSTCSRRRRTSSASRCSRPARPASPTPTASDADPRHRQRGPPRRGARARAAAPTGHDVVGLDVLAVAVHRPSSARSPTATLVAARASRGADAVLHAATLHKPHVGSPRAGGTSSTRTSPAR